MIKKIILLLSFIAVLLIVSAAGVGYMVMRGIMNFPRLTLEQVYENKVQRDVYGIGEAHTPVDYGFAFQEISYPSSGGITLYGWYVRPKNAKSDQCYLLFHGRSSNRLKSLKYLELISALGLHQDYAVFMPDLRNSGRSDLAPTAMGFYFAEDIFHTMLYLNASHGRRRFILHGFSMGAMGISCLIARKGVMDTLHQRGIVIESIILDSPVANVRRNVFADITKGRGLPSVVAYIGLAALDMKLGGFLDNMALGNIYAGTSLPVLIMSAKDDTKTPIEFLEKEYEKLKGSGVRLVVFEKGNHARLFNEERDKYVYTMRKFFADVKRAKAEVR